MVFMPPAGGYHSLEPNHKSARRRPRGEKGDKVAKRNGRLERLFPPLRTRTNELQAQRSSGAAQPMGFAIVPRWPAPLFPTRFSAATITPANSASS